MNSSKEEMVARILRNDVYLPESGVYRNVAKALLKMSKADLAGLDIIFTMRRIEEGQLARDVTKLLSK